MMVAGQSYVKRLCGGIGIETRKGRSQFAITNVATQINSVEQVWLFFHFLFSCQLAVHIILGFM